jgi:hypothetical protein
MEGMTPLQVADTLTEHADRALALVAELRPLVGQNKELRLTLGDCEAMGHLGHYYAQKILAASNLALFDQNGQGDLQAEAVRQLQASLDHWKKYAAVATAQYLPQKLGRVGPVDLSKLAPKVEADITLAKDWPKGSVQGNGDVRTGDINFRP